MIQLLRPDREKMLLNMIKNNQFDKLIEFISENPIVADQKLPIMGLYLAHALISQNSRTANNNNHIGPAARREIENKIVNTLKILEEKSSNAVNYHDDVRHYQRKRGYRMLHYACMFGYLEILKAFYENEERNSKNGETLLMSAVRFNSIDCANYLMERQPWILQRNHVLRLIIESGKTALDIAEQMQAQQCVNSLKVSKVRQERFLILRQLTNWSDDIDDEKMKSVRSIFFSMKGYSNFFFSLF